MKAKIALHSKSFYGSGAFALVKVNKEESTIVEASPEETIGIKTR